MNRKAEIQMELLGDSSTLIVPPEGGVLRITRPYLLAYGLQDEVDLVTVELLPFEGEWMWDARINALDETLQATKAHPDLKNIAKTKHEAVIMAVDYVRDFLHKASHEEQARIIKWLGQVLSYNASAGG